MQAISLSVWIILLNLMTKLAVAQEKGVLHRNFQGYTTQEECDLLGLGVSAISLLGDTYAQNQKE